MSIEALNWALRQEVKPSAAKFVLVILCNYANEHGQCDPSQQRIAQLTGMTEKTVRGHLSQLVAKNFIARMERRHPDGTRKRDIYTINRSELPVDTSRKNLPVDDTTQNASESPGKQPKNGQGSSKDQPVKSTGNTKDSTKDLYTSAFLEFYEVYPRHDSKFDGAKAYDKAVVKDKIVSHETLKEAAAAYAELVDGKDPKYVKLPASFINKRGWEDASIREKMASVKEAKEPEIGQYDNVTSPWLLDTLKAVETQIRAQRGTDFWRTWWKMLTFFELDGPPFVDIRCTERSMVFIKNNGVYQLIRDAVKKNGPVPEGTDPKLSGPNPYAIASAPS